MPRHRLSGEAQKEWRRLCPMLYRHGMLKESSLLLWSDFCQTLAYIRILDGQIAKLISSNGQQKALFDGAPTGSRIMDLRRLMSTRAELSGQILRVLKEVGMLPEMKNIIPLSPTERARFFGRRRPNNSKRPAGGLLAEMDGEDDSDEGNPQPAA